MDPQLLSLLNLVRDALVAVAIIFGLSQCFSGYRLFDLVRQLPGALAGLVIAGGVAQLLWHDWPPTLLAKHKGPSIRGQAQLSPAGNE